MPPLSRGACVQDRSKAVSQGPSGHARQEKKIKGTL
jgi:hypothetical protein